MAAAYGDGVVLLPEREEPRLTLSGSVRPSSWSICAYFLDGMSGFSMLQVFMIQMAAHTFLFPPFLLSLALWGVWEESSRLATLAVVLLYVATAYDGAEQVGLRVWPGFIHFWRQTHSFFPVTIKMWTGEGWSTEPCDEQRNVYNVLTDGEVRLSGGPGVQMEGSGRRFIFGMHPHGPIPLSASVLPPQLQRWPWLLRRLRIGVASVVFQVPFLREFYTSFGSVDASRTSLELLLERGYSILLLPGGIREQLIVCKEDEEVIVLKRRTGFIKMALKYGASLVPVFGFGERQGYVVSSLLLFFSHLLRKVCRAGVPVLRGQCCTLLPWPHPVTVVIGKPIPVAQTPDPTPEQVKELLEAYTEQVVQLYEEHKEEAGYGDIVLKVI